MHFVIDFPRKFRLSYICQESSQFIDPLYDLQNDLFFLPIFTIRFSRELVEFRRNARHHHVVGHAVGAGANGQQVVQVETRSESKC